MRKNLKDALERAFSVQKPEVLVAGLVYLVTVRQKLVVVLVVNQEPHVHLVVDLFNLCLRINLFKL